MVYKENFPKTYLFSCTCFFIMVARSKGFPTLCIRAKVEEGRFESRHSNEGGAFDCRELRAAEVVGWQLVLDRKIRNNVCFGSAVVMGR